MDPSLDRWLTGKHQSVAVCNDGVKLRTQIMAEARDDWAWPHSR